MDHLLELAVLVEDERIAEFEDGLEELAEAVHERIRLRLVGPVAPYDFAEAERMGLISGILGLPIAPLRGVVAAAEQVRRQAEEEFYDPVAIRQQLEEVERLREEGVLTDDEAMMWEDELVERLLVARDRPGREQ